MTHSRWIRARFAGLACAFLVACGGGGSGGGGSDGVSTADPNSPPQGGTGGTSSPGAITAALQRGSVLEFLATSKSSSSSPAGTSTSSDYGIFRLTLGAPAVVGGVSGFVVTVSGKAQVGGHDFKPRWTFLGLTGQRWVGSSDGTALTTLYDPALPPGTTGFFLNVPAGRRVSAQPATLKGAYNDYGGIALNDATSDGGCQLVLSITLCSDTATTFTQTEYLKNGLGPVGMTQHIAYSAGGTAPEVINMSLTLELIGSSLTATDGTKVTPPPWSDAPAMPIGRINAFAAAIGHKIYLYGGTSTDPAFSGERIDVFDIASGTWSRGADAPQSLSTWRGVDLGGRVAMFSGTQGWLHDPVSGTWTPTATAPAGIGLLGAWAHADGTTDVVALFDRGLAYLTATLYRYTVATNTWSAIGDISKGQRSQYKTATVGDDFFLIGGYAVGDYVTSSIDVNLATSQYGTIAGRLSEGIVDFSTAKLNGKVYVVGGTNIGHGPQRNVQIIDPATGAIGAGPAMFAGRYAAAAVVADGKLYLMGGTVAGEPGVSSSSVAVLSP